MRTCGTCNLCCKIPAIKALGKPAGVWCQYARPGNGCSIHGQHPDECKTFMCAWLTRPSMEESWKPSISKMVLKIEGTGMLVHVDPGAPGAWKKQPYYSALKRASEALWEGPAHVFVYEGQDTTVIFPEEDLHIGPTVGGDIVVVAYRRTPISRQPYVRITRENGEVVERLGGLHRLQGPRPVA